MSTLTTGLAGQQQLRSARRGGPDQAAWPSAALALRCGNLILVPSASGRRPSSQHALPGCSSSPLSSHSRAAFGHSYCLLRHWRRCRLPSMRRTWGGHLSQASLVEAAASAHDALRGRSGHCVLGGQVLAAVVGAQSPNFDFGPHSLHYRSHFARPAEASSQRDERGEVGPSQDEEANDSRAIARLPAYFGPGQLVWRIAPRDVTLGGQESGRIL
jgi:hypothetical protein